VFGELKVPKEMADWVEDDFSHLDWFTFETLCFREGIMQQDLDYIFEDFIKKDKQASLDKWSSGN